MKRTLRDRLIAAIREQIATNAEVQFETVEDFICGLELRDLAESEALRGLAASEALRDRDYKITWNIEHYLKELEGSIAKVLAENNNQAT